MTENKPVAWIYEFYPVSRGVWVTECFSTTDPANYTGTLTRNVEPLYRHPPAPQPDADPAVEAARRKALRAIFAKLAEYPTRDDRFTVGLSLALLRDLVGEPRKQPEQKVWGYDEQPPTPRFEGVWFDGNPNAVNVETKPQPARLSVDQIAEAMSGADGLTFRFSGACQRMARAVHEAIYGKGE